MLKTKMILLLIIVSTALLTKVHAELDGDRFHSEQWQVSMKAPKGWHLNDSGSYPNILLWMERRHPNARMLFSAENIAPDIDAGAYAASVEAALKKKGYTLRSPQLHSATGAYWFDFHNEKYFLRQALLLPNHSGIAYSLTLSTSDIKTRGQFLRAFDSTLRSITPVRNTLPSKATKDAATKNESIPDR